MTVENIKNAIIGDAQKEAERIRTAGRKKADEKFRRAEQALRRDYQRRIADAEKHQQNAKSRSIIALRSALSMQVLEAKNAVIDQVLDAAVERLINLPSGGYKNILLKWLSDAASQEPAQLILNSRDKDSIGKELIDSVNTNRAEAAAVTLAEDAAEISGGFVLGTARYEIDKSLDAIVAKLKEEMAPEIAAELFSGRIERF